MSSHSQLQLPITCHCGTTTPYFVEETPRVQFQTHCPTCSTARTVTLNNGLVVGLEAIR